MSIYSQVKKMAYIRPFHNVGAGFDHLTGSSKYHIGAHGEAILSGGLPGIVTIAGPGNSHKTTISEFLSHAVVHRYGPPPGIKEVIMGAVTMKYDSENSGTWMRLSQLLARWPGLAEVDWGDPGMDDAVRKFFITTNVEQYLDEWWNDQQNIYEEKRKIAKKIMLTTPFVRPDGTAIQTLPPTTAMIDSMSRGEIKEVLKRTFEKTDSVGGSETNMYAMASNKAKGHIISQMSEYNSPDHYNVSFIMTAHVGEEFNLDPYAPQKQSLTHRKRGTKITNASNTINYINTTLLEIDSARLLNNSTKGTGVLYPKIDELDRIEDSKDLLEIVITPTRNKAGPSGHKLYLVLSQREGVLPHLTQFHHIHSRTPDGNPYGIIGDPSRNYSLALLPDLSLQRTRVRKEIDDNPKLRRAIEITSEMLQIKTMFNVQPNYVPSPADLREKLIKDGYDWDVLLDTRGWWTFLEFEKYVPQKYLSTWDLIRMYHGTYRPYWLKN